MTAPGSNDFEAWQAVAESGNFEASLDALEQSVALLEHGGLSLGDMTTCYELGLKLSRRCSDLLRDAELKITLLDREFSADHAPAEGFDRFDPDDDDE